MERGGRGFSFSPRGLKALPDLLCLWLFYQTALSFQHVRNRID